MLLLPFSSVKNPLYGSYRCQFLNHCTLCRILYYCKIFYIFRFLILIYNTKFCHFEECVGSIIRNECDEWVQNFSDSFLIKCVSNLRTGQLRLDGESYDE